MSCTNYFSVLKTCGKYKRVLHNWSLLYDFEKTEWRMLWKENRGYCQNIGGWMGGCLEFFFSRIKMKLLVDWGKGCIESCDRKWRGFVGAVIELIECVDVLFSYGAVSLLFSSLLDTLEWKEADPGERERGWEKERELMLSFTTEYTLRWAGIQHGNSLEALNTHTQDILWEEYHLCLQHLD